MPATGSKDNENKSFSTQTVRVPSGMRKPINRLLAETDESFQGFVMRLIERELAIGSVLDVLPISGDHPLAQKRPKSYVNNPGNPLAKGDNADLKSLDSGNSEAKPGEVKWVERFRGVYREGDAYSVHGLLWNVVLVERSMGVFNEDPVADIGPPGSQRLSNAAMERIRGKIESQKRTIAGAKRSVRNPAPARKRPAPPKEDFA